MTYASGNHYKGDWVMDKKEGDGIMFWHSRNEEEAFDEKVNYNY